MIYNLQNKKYMERAITIIFQRMVKKRRLFWTLRKKADVFREKEWQKQNKDKYADYAKFL